MVKIHKNDPSTTSTTQVNFQKLKITSRYQIMALLKNSNRKTSQLFIRVLELLGGRSIETETVTVEIIRVVKKAADDDCEIPRLELNNETVETEG